MTAFRVVLLGARLPMGLSEGGVMPISHALVAAEVSTEPMQKRMFAVSVSGL